MLATIPVQSAKVRTSCASCDAKGLPWMALAVPCCGSAVQSSSTRSVLQAWHKPGLAPLHSHEHVHRADAAASS